MPVLHLKDEESVEGERIAIKENGWAFVIRGGETTSGYPPEQIEKVDVDTDVYTDSYLHEEEYGETRATTPDERGESVTEFKPVHRIELEYQVE